MEIPDFLPDLSEIKKRPLIPTKRLYAVLFLGLIGIISFVGLTNAIYSLKIKLFIFISLAIFTLFAFHSYLPTLLFIYVLTAVLWRIRFYINEMYFNVLDFYIALLIILMLGNKVITRDLTWRYSPFNKYVYFFIGACLVATVRGFTFGSLPINVFHEAIYYTLYTALFFIVFNSVKKRTEVNFYVWLFFVITFLLCLYGIVEYLRGTGYEGFIQYKVRTRIRTTLGNANIYAGYLVVILSLAVCYLMVEKRLARRTFLGVLIGLAAVNLAMTFSRGGFIGALISLFLILSFRVRKKIYSIIVLVLLVIVFLAASAFIARQLSVFNIAEITEGRIEEGSFMARILSYSGNIKNIMENPIFGVGWGARFGYTPYGYYRPSYRVEQVFGHGNSTFLDIFVHTGIIGLVAFYAMVAALIVNLFKQAKTITDGEAAALPWGLFAGYSGLFFHLIFDGYIKWPGMGSVFWILTGLAFANWYVYATEKGITRPRWGIGKLEILNPFKDKLTGSSEGGEIDD